MTITDEQTVGEIASASLGAVRVFETRGIDYCCGGSQTLKEVCQERGLDAAVIGTEIEAATRETGGADRDWTTASLAYLIHHIVSTHHEYLKLELPRLNERMNKVLSVHGDKDPETLPALSQTLRGLWDELDPHMQKEEMMLFPAIERFEQAVAAKQPPPPLPFGTFKNPVHMMMAEHDNAGDALRRISELTHGYELPEYACSTVRALYEGLRELESDLHRHIHLENNILFPRAIELERAAG